MKDIRPVKESIRKWLIMTIMIKKSLRSKVLPAGGRKTTIGHFLFDGLRLYSQLGKLGGQIAVGRDGDFVRRNDGARGPATSNLLTRGLKYERSRNRTMTFGL